MKLIDKIFLAVETALCLIAMWLFTIPCIQGQSIIDGSFPYPYRNISFSLIAVANLIAVWYLVFRKERE